MPIAIPIETPDHAEDLVVIVLDAASLGRMKQADPFELTLRQTGHNLVNPTVVVCYENDNPELARLLNSRDLPGLLRHLGRGFQFRPEAGDHDRGPERLQDHQ